MSDTTIQDLMTRNLFEVFGERDGDRRAAAIAEVHAPDTTMYVGGEVIEGAAAVSSHVQALLDGAPGSSSAPRERSASTTTSAAWTGSSAPRGHLPW